MRKSPRARNEPQSYSQTPTRRDETTDRPIPATPTTGATSSTAHETSTTGKVAIEDEGYGDMHKIVLQGIMSAGYLDVKGVKRLFIGACTYLKLSSDERTTMRYVQQVVREINDRIRTYDMAIKSASCELTGKKYYIFLITVEKPIMKLQTLFSTFEIELFEKCMEKILRKYNNFSVPLQECVEISKEINEPKASVELARSFIEKMISFNYFTKYLMADGESNVTLGFRTIREFEPILREMYHDVIAKCSLCNMILLHGYLCPKCKLLIHKSCFTRYVTTSNQCPNCRVSWAKEKDMVRRVREEAEQEVEFDFSANNPDSQDQDSQDSQEIDLPPTPIPDISSVETHLPDDEDEDMPILEPMVRLGRKGRRTRALASSSEDSE